ncbi:MAG: hypothetical protein WB699_08510 [Bacteroidota bacterium]
MLTQSRSRRIARQKEAGKPAPARPHGGLANDRFSDFVTFGRAGPPPLESQLRRVDPPTLALRRVSVVYADVMRHAFQAAVVVGHWR